MTFKVDSLLTLLISEMKYQINIAVVIEEYLGVTYPQKNLSCEHNSFLGCIKFL